MIFYIFYCQLIKKFFLLKLFNTFALNNKSFKMKNNIIFIILILVCIKLFILKLPSINPESTFTSDPLEYYLYFPTYIIFNDSNESEFLNNSYAWKYFWFKYTEEEVPILKFSMGVTLLYSPFYFAAYLYCKTFDYIGHGFERPNAIAMYLANLFYFILGLFFLRKLLLKLFNKLSAELSIILIASATNIGYYVFYMPGMSHIPTFFFFSIFLYYSYMWHKYNKNIYLIYIGLAFGFMFLIRPVNIILACPFIFLNTLTTKDLTIKLRNLLTNKNFYLLPIISLAIAFPQFLYWKLKTNSWVYYTYNDEFFFFTDPKIIESLFSYRAGLFIYSPILLFSLLGFKYIKKNLTNWFLPILITLIIFTYISSSWWCWWYVGFGNRSYIDIFPLFAILIAILFEQILSLKKIYKISAFLLMMIFVLLSVFQTLQAGKGIIHYCGMNKDAYWSSFLKTRVDRSYYNKITMPDFDLAKKGYRETIAIKQGISDSISYTNTFDYYGGFSPNAPYFFGFAKNGYFSQKLDEQNEFSTTFTDSIYKISPTLPDSIRVNTWVFTTNDTISASLVFHILENNETIFYSNYPLKKHITKTNKWQKFSITIPWRSDFRPHHILKIYFWNKNHEIFYIDDFNIKVYYQL